MVDFNDLKKPYLIAEIGINHNGDIKLAERLISATKATGWDCAKFQKRNPDVCVPEEQKSQLRQTPWGEMKYIDYKHHVEFGKKDFDRINKYCQLVDVNWTASVWDYDSLDFLTDNYEVPFLKIPSAINGSFQFVEDCAKTGIPLVISLGMSDLKTSDKIVDIVSKHSNGFCIMHTNSAYPSPHEDLQLSLIPFFIDRYNCTVGYSGHEEDLEPTVIAVALGAQVIERHVTLDHSMWGSDHKSSLEVHAMDILTKRISVATRVMGKPEKKIFNSEEPFIKKLKNDNIHRS